MTAPTPSPPKAIRVLLIDHHRLLVESLSQWLLVNAPGITVLAEASDWPLGSHADDGGAGTGADGGVTGTGADDGGANVAVVGELDDAGSIGELVSSLRASGAQVVMLAGQQPLADIISALDAGALAVVPKSAGPGHTAAAIRAAASGQHFVHADIGARLESAAVARVELSRREHRLVELYLGPAPLGTKEVAEHMKISEQTVKSHLHRVRQRYAAAGYNVGNVISLQDQLRKDGWLG